MVQFLWETVWRVFKKLNTELSYNPIIQLLNLHQKEHISPHKNLYTCTWLLITALFIIA